MEDVEAIVRGLSPLQVCIITKMSDQWCPVFETTALNLAASREYRPPLLEIGRVNRARRMRLTDAGQSVRTYLLSQTKE